MLQKKKKIQILEKHKHSKKYLVLLSNSQLPPQKDTLKTHCYFKLNSSLGKKKKKTGILPQKQFKVGETCIFGKSIHSIW